MPRFRYIQLLLTLSRPGACKFVYIYARTVPEYSLVLPSSIRHLQAFVEKAIEEVRDLEETDFAAEPRDAEAFIKEAIEKVRDLEPTDFSKIFDDVEEETD